MGVVVSKGFLLKEEGKAFCSARANAEHTAAKGKESCGDAVVFGENPLSFRQEKERSGNGRKHIKNL